MNPKYAVSHQHKIKRRKLFELIKKQQEVGRKLHDADYNEQSNQGDVRSAIEINDLNEKYDRLGQEIDHVHEELLGAMKV